MILKKKAKLKKIKERVAVLAEITWQQRQIHSLDTFSCAFLHKVYLSLCRLLFVLFFCVCVFESAPEGRHTGVTGVYFLGP